MTLDPDALNTHLPPLTPRQRAHADLISTLYVRLPWTLGGVLLGAIALAWVMWDRVSPLVLSGWIGAVLAYSAWRVNLLRRFPAQFESRAQLNDWSRLWVIGSVIIGTIWGSAGIIMFLPEQPAQQALVLTALLAIAMVSMPLNARLLPALYGFSFPVLLPVAVRLLIHGEGWQIFLAAITLLVLYGIVLFGREYHDNLREAIERRYENIDLIAELEAQKADLERARLEAENANLSKTRFLAAASHDLRQPLHALGLFSAALQARTREPEDKRLAQNISISVEALEKQFNALLDISKLDAGVIKPVTADFALGPLIERMRLEYEGAAQAQGVALRTVPCSLVVASDPMFVERILRNLVSNAVRYTERGRILVGCRRRGGQALVQVWDTGIGIPAEHVDKIWEEFYQVGNPERDRQKGLGLGLATAKRLVRLIDSRIEVRSAPGRGTVFSFALPLGRAKPVAPLRPAPEDAVPADSLAGKLVVAIDDERSVREGMEAVLGLWKCDVLAAGSLEEALDRLPDFGRYPDVLLVDYRLREGVTGVDVIKRIRRELGIDVPALLISGTTLPESLVEIEAAGFDLLYKPVTAELLRERVLRLLHAPA
jgi:signal transduction histidine kinase/CheY-like chemotaxis protein